MRKAFIKAVAAAAAEDERVWLVCGDLGYSVLEHFQERFPERYLNAGVAEQNMTGIAAGLALSGKTVFTYSIANFPVMRCLEQIRNDVCYHDLPVIIVAVGGGLAYGAAGYSHHAVEDLAVMRIMPNMTVFTPADPMEATWAVSAAITLQRPCYIRLGKATEPVLHKMTPIFQVGRAVVLQTGHDVALLSAGGILENTLEAARKLASAGVSVSVVSFPTIQPIDAETILAAAADHKAVFTLEEHGLGGFGSAVAEVLAGSGYRSSFRALRISGGPIPIAGSQEQLREICGLSAARICDTVLAVMREGRR